MEVAGSNLGFAIEQVANPVPIVLGSLCGFFLSKRKAIAISVAVIVVIGVSLALLAGFGGGYVRTIAVGMSGQRVDGPVWTEGMNITLYLTFLYATSAAIFAWIANVLRQKVAKANSSSSQSSMEERK
ncbi:hypothetical protein [Roseovarius sp. EL26]|uniref:hypothetical protein n=1 Tax=Roseovarius sp. EL26 TaxID=2126672 RepID=UPI000EA3AF39|nr:hypothetical protein [Roseovarius sp. EL26]